MSAMQNIKPTGRYTSGIISSSDLSKCKNKESVVFRSSWELDYIKILESNDNVDWWTSECLCIPYLYNLKRHRYYPDFLVHLKDGSYYIVEIKPYHESVMPQLTEGKKYTQKQLKNFNYNKKVYIKNMFKWKSAQTFCEKMSTDKNISIQFKVVTERDLYKKSV